MKNNVVDNLSLILQTLSLQILFQDYNNRDLMQELQTQDEKYLKKIISQNEEILGILKERSKSNGREDIRENK
jgi:hypothetical protein